MIAPEMKSDAHTSVNQCTPASNLPIAVTAVNTEHTVTVAIFNPFLSLKSEQIVGIAVINMQATSIV